MQTLITSCRDTLLFHNVGRFIALSDIIHPSIRPCHSSIQLIRHPSSLLFLLFLSVPNHARVPPRIVPEGLSDYPLRETTAGDRIDHFSTNSKEPPVRQSLTAIRWLNNSISLSPTQTEISCHRNNSFAYLSLEDRYAVCERDRHTTIERCGC